MRVAHAFPSKDAAVISSMSQAFNDLRKELSKGSLAQITVAAIDAPSIIATDIRELQ